MVGSSWAGRVIAVAAATVIGVGAVVVGSTGQSEYVAAPTPTATATPTPTPTPDPGLGNLWAIPDASPNGSCTRSALLETRAAAELGGRVCNPGDNAAGVLRAALVSTNTGDTVCIADGDYGRQGLASSSKTVTMEACESGRPVFGQIVSAATFFTLRHVKIEGRDNASGQCPDLTNAILYPCGTDQTFDDVEVDGLGDDDLQGVRGAGDRFTFKNGSIHGIRDLKGMEIGAADSLIAYNRFYDIVQVALEHEECIYYDGGNNTVFRGNSFEECPIMSLFLTQYVGGPPYSGIVIENNTFSHTRNASAIHNGCTLVIGGNANREYVGWSVRNNTLDTCAIAEESPSTNDDTGSSEFVGNLGGSIDCGTPEWVRAYNVSNSPACTGGGDHNNVVVTNAVNTSVAPNQAPFYVNSAIGDFHLINGTAALGAGDPTNYPATDKDGVARTSPPDAGAFEYVGG